MQIVSDSETESFVKTGNVYLVRLLEFSYSVRSVDQSDSQMSIMTHKWLLIIYESEMMTHHSALRALSKLIPPGP